MKAYSQDLREKIVEAVNRGMGKSATARVFGVSLSSVKRYAKMAREGPPLAPKKRPGSRPKLDQYGRRLLENDLGWRPAATLSERRKYLERVAGISVSESTISRLLKSLGWTRKKIRGSERTRRVAESGLAGAGRRGGLRQAARVCGRDGQQHFAGSRLCLVPTRRASTLFGATQPG
jgi:transposase